MDCSGELPVLAQMLSGATLGMISGWAAALCSGAQVVCSTAVRHFGKSNFLDLGTTWEKAAKRPTTGEAKLKELH